MLVCCLIGGISVMSDFPKSIFEHLLPQLDSWEWKWDRGEGERWGMTYKRSMAGRHLGKLQLHFLKLLVRDFNSPVTISSACERRHVKNPLQHPTVDYGPNSAGCQCTDPTTSSVTTHHNTTNNYLIQQVNIWGFTVHSYSLQSIVEYQCHAAFQAFHYPT